MPTGYASTTSEYSTILLPIKEWLILDVWWYRMWYTLTKRAPSKHLDNNVGGAKIDPTPARSVPNIGRR